MSKAVWTGTHSDIYRMFITIKSVSCNISIDSVATYARLAVCNISVSYAGNVGCKFQVNMVNIPYGSSCLTIAFISFERYCAICRPMDVLDCVKERLKYIVPSIWLLSITIYFPTLYFCGQNQMSEGDQLSCDCTYRWPSLKAKNIYGVGIVVVLYVMPLTVASYFYSSVIRRLKQVNVTGDKSATSQLEGSHDLWTSWVRNACLKLPISLHCLPQALSC